MKKKNYHKVLVVDDDTIIRYSVKLMLRRIMTKHGIELEILEGSDGLELISHVVNDPINIKLILTDENMPICDGSEAVNVIYNLKKMNNIKIISITAVDDLVTIKKILKCGADEVVSKPMHMYTLERIVFDYLM